MVMRMAYGGQILTSSRMKITDAGTPTIVDFDSNVVVNASPVAPPPPVAPSQLGVYYGGPSGDQAIRDAFGNWPDISSTYYQFNQVANAQAEIARLQRGTSVLTTRTTRNTPANPNGSQRLVEIANNDNTNGAIDWLDEWIASLEVIGAAAAEINAANPSAPEVKVYATVEHEYSVKSNPDSGIYSITGEAESFEVGAAVLSRFIQRCRINAPHVIPIMWEGYFRVQYILDLMDAMTENPDVLSFDPYVHGGAFRTAEQDWDAILAPFRGTPQYASIGSPPISISEFGISIENYTDQQCAVYYTNLRQQMAAADISPFAVFWCRNSADQHDIISSTTNPLARQAFAASLADDGGAPPATQVTGIGATVTTIGDPDSTGVITENSGLVVSHKNSGAAGRVLWAVNDQGPARIYAIDDVSGSEIIATVTLGTIANAGQFEELAIGPGPDPDKQYIYVFRCGNGAGDPRRIYRFEEPAVTAGQAHQSITISDANIRTFSYTPPWPDTEAAFVDPVSGDLVLFQKKSTVTRPSTSEWRVFDNVAAMTTSQTITPNASGTAISHVDTTNDGGFTGAGISKRGRAIMLTNYQEVWLWNRDTSESIVTTLSRAADLHQHFPTGWGTESIALDAGEQPARFYTLGEGVGTSLKYGTLTYS